MQQTECSEAVSTVGIESLLRIGEGAAEGGDGGMAEIPLSFMAKALTSSDLQESLLQMGAPDLISFAVGLPTTDLFPVAAYNRALQQVLKTDPLALQYTRPYTPLKRHIVQIMAR